MPEIRDDRAFRLLSTSAVTLFWRRGILEENVAWLVEHGYQVFSFDAARWATEADLHRDVAVALDFPEYYGRNLAALNDCMRDVVVHMYGWRPDAAGLVLVFKGYDEFAGRHPEIAWHVLDIMADQSRQALLRGDWLLCLVQTGDPQLEFEPVGSTPVAWNEAEWASSRRGG